MEKRALVVIDLQKDFTLPSGKLPACTAEVDRILPVVNAAAALPEAGEVIIITTQWRNWWTRFRARNSVAPGSPGAELDERLRIKPAAVFTKTTQSALSSKLFCEHLEARQISALTLCGVAAEYCIKATCLDALRQGFSVTLLTDGIASDTAGARDEVFEELAQQGAFLTSSAGVYRGA